MLHSFCFLNVRLFFAINSIIFDCKIKLWSDQKKKENYFKRPYSGIYFNIAPSMLDPSNSSPNSWRAPVQSRNR